MLMKQYIHIISLGLICLWGCTGSNSESNQESAPVKTESETKEVSKPQRVEEITIRTQGNSLTEMSYDLQEISVTEGSKVKITLINQATDSAMIHNIVFVYEGTRNATATAGLKAGPEKDYVPDLITVIAASHLAKPGETVALEFDAPEVGSYYFICTYPGHWQKMTGVFKVTALAG